MSEYKYVNKLIHEKSPYLLQHAHNAVNWFPWGEEAFEKAKNEDKPIFLSIGYSTCHWCHVMERESFENEEVANVINKSFVSIKVDREERPDIDSIYMNACQLMTGSGGWPLSIFMTADKKPFFAGTYFPKDDRMGMTGFLSALENINTLWRENRDLINRHTEEIISALSPRKKKTQSINESVPEEIFNDLLQRFDRENGGFSYAPKFPTPHNLLFLMRYYASTRKKEALEMCGKTLDSMRRGGIFDQIGFGFSRYSTDRVWLVPHFEKMLYDNALMCIAYAEFYSITKDERYAKTAREIIQYLMDKMHSENGGFYTAEDADSEGVEGKFYVFTPQEVRQVLGVDAEEYCRYFDITERGNFEGLNIPNLIKTELPDERRDFAEKCRMKLYEYREKRVHPYLDDKILTSQNGLIIAALSVAGRALQDDSYIAAARKTVKFLIENMVDKNGKLLSRYRDKEARFLGYDDDYAFVIWGLIELYESTFDQSYLDLAVSFNKVFINQFFDEKNGGFFQSDIDSEKMLFRQKSVYDGAVPSANSVQVLNLIRLARLTGSQELEKIAENTLESLMEEISYSPISHTFHAINILYLRNGGTDVKLVADEKKKLDAMLSVLREGFHPFVTVFLASATEDAKGEQKDNVYKMMGEKPTAYVCKEFSCMPPVTSASELKTLIQ